MTRELFIEGQSVDLAPDTDITLEYVSNIIGDLGKINLSRSYTVKIPKTARNTRILDDPGQPGHESASTRRFLTARFYKNGIDLIGPAQAYILTSTQNTYEIALVWNALEALQTLSQSSATLNDLPGLPVLTWIGENGKTPDYTGANDMSGALFAFYNSGLGGVKYPEVETATHPSMRISNLLARIFLQSGVVYRESAEAYERLRDLVVLAAPSHAPSRKMEVESGSSTNSVSLIRSVINNTVESTGIMMESWTDGWDATHQVVHNVIHEFIPGDNDTHRILLNLRAPAGVSLNGMRLGISAYKIEEIEGVEHTTDSEILAWFYFKEDDEGWYLYADEELKLSGWDRYSIGVGFSGDPYSVSATLQPYDASLPMIAANRVHESIRPSDTNVFPLQGNLPDIKQWDLLKGVMAMLGLVPIIQSGELLLTTYDEVLNTDDAYDWTAKVDMSKGEDLNYALNNWARRNTITFKANDALGFEPDADLVIEDRTLSEQRKMSDLPFAASMQAEAVHYRIKDEGYEDIDIEPRIFRVGAGEQGQTLQFEADMYGEGLIQAYYARLQETIRKPVSITVDIRLHEIDLAQLDLTRPVYLGQYGRYYAILKIQTSKTDLCKVELLQLP